MQKIFFQQIVSVSTANIFAQLLIALSSLVMGVILGPELFAEYSIIFGIGMIISMVVSLKLELVIFDVPMVERVDTAIKVLFIAFILSLIIGLLILILVLFDFLLNIHLLAIFFGWSIAAQVTVLTFFVASEEYSTLNQLRLLHAVFLSVGQICIALVLESASSVIIIHIITNFCIAAYFLQQHFNNCNSKNFSSLAIVHMIKANFRYVKFTMPAEFVGSTAGLAPIIIIQAYFGATAAGLYAMAVRIAGVPSGFIGKAVGEVFRGNLSNSKSGTDQIRLFDQTLYILLTLSISVGCLIFLLDSIKFVDSMFSQEWSGLIQALLITWLFFGVKLIASPLSYSLLFFQKNNIDFYWQFLMLMSLTIPLLFSSNFMSALLLQSLIGGFAYLILIYYCRSLFKN